MSAFRNPDDPGLQSAPYGGQPINPNGSKDPNEIPKWQRTDLGPDNLLPWQTNLPGYNTAIAAGMWREGLDGDNIDRKGLTEHGIDNANPGGLGAGDSLGSGSLNAMSSALKSKYDSETSGKVKNLKDQFSVNDDEAMRRSNTLSRAAEIYGKDQAKKLQNFTEQYNFQKERQALWDAHRRAEQEANSKTVSDILGLATFGITKLAGI